MTLKNNRKDKNRNGLNVLLRIPNYFVQLDETILHCLLQCFLYSSIDLFHKAEPDQLGFPSSRNEWFISQTEDVEYLLEYTLQLYHHIFSMFNLFLLKLRDQVWFLLIYMDEHFTSNLLTLQIDLLTVCFEHLQLVVKLSTTAFTRSSQETINV